MEEEIGNGQLNSSSSLTSEYARNSGFAMVAQNVVI